MAEKRQSLPKGYLEAGQAEEIEWLSAIAQTMQESRPLTREEKASGEIQNFRHGLAFVRVTVPIEKELSVRQTVFWSDTVADSFIKRALIDKTFSDEPPDHASGKDALLALLNDGNEEEPIDGNEEEPIDGNEEEPIDGNEDALTNPLWEAGRTVQTALADLLDTVKFTHLKPGRPSDAQREALAKWNVERLRISKLLREKLSWKTHEQMQPGFSKRIAERLAQFRWVYPRGKRALPKFLLTDDELCRLEIRQDFKRRYVDGADREQVLDELVKLHARPPKQRNAHFNELLRHGDFNELRNADFNKLWKKWIAADIEPWEETLYNWLSKEREYIREIVERKSIRSRNPLLLPLANNSAN